MFLFIDRSVSFEAVRPLMYSSGQAQYSSFDIIVFGEAQGGEPVVVDRIQNMPDSLCQALNISGVSSVALFPVYSEAKVLGVILNQVKPEAGPEYFRYHSHYYYGSETKEDKKKIKLKSWLQPPQGSIIKGKYQKGTILLIALILLALGIYWQDLHLFIPDWFAAFKGLFVAR